MTDMYLIWSNEHRAWWRNGGWGYCSGTRGAGVFSRDQALEICRAALRTAPHLGAIAEIPVRLEDIMDMLRDQDVPEEVLKGKNG